MRKLVLILISLLLAVSLPAHSEDFDMTEVIFEHIGDSYEWHIATFGDTDVSIYLPVIVRGSETGWHVFSSRHLYKDGEWEGFHIAPSGAANEGKIVAADGTRPLDISITKNVLSLIMSSILLAILILLTARWYKRHDPTREAPSGIAAYMEPVVMMVHEMARENIGEDYRRFSPYLITAFTFILLNNFMGIIPIFPGGANLTGNIAITLVLALITFLTFMLNGTWHFYGEMLNPDVPIFLKPIMPVIEIFSNLIRPVSLTIRLFANMLAGHIQIISVVLLIFIMAKYGPLMCGGMTVVSVGFGLFLDALELLISFIQAYVFTMLSSIYIGLARAKE